MPTGRTLTGTSTARAALAGNPSDGYGGAVVAIPIDDLFAMASTADADRFEVDAADPELHRLLTASADAFSEAIGPLPSVRMSASTTIPRSVGLAGSSAIVIAALRALAARRDHRWQPVALAELALSVERDRLGIAAGLQDRLVQAVGRPVAMTFDPVGYHEVDLPDGLPLFVAWAAAAAEPSDRLHRSLRRRHDGGDPAVHEAMRALTDQAVVARRAIARNDRARLAAAMDRSFDLRASMVDVGGAQRHLVELGRSLGAAVNSAGSGGSIVGLARSAADLEPLAAAYERAGAEFLAVTP